MAAFPASKAVAAGIAYATHVRLNTRSVGLRTDCCQTFPLLICPSCSKNQARIWDEAVERVYPSTLAKTRLREICARPFDRGKACRLRSRTYCRAISNPDFGHRDRSRLSTGELHDLFGRARTPISSILSFPASCATRQQRGVRRSPDRAGGIGVLALLCDLARTAELQGF